jgi:hypothetical protein
MSRYDEDLDLAIKILLKHASNSGGVIAHGLDEVPADAPV